MLEKSNTALRTISETAEEVKVPTHVLRFWESRFTQIKPIKRAGGRRYYSPDDIILLKAIYHLLRVEGRTIKGVQKILNKQGMKAVLEGKIAPIENPKGKNASTSLEAVKPDLQKIMDDLVSLKDLLEKKN
ncbi:MAG: MerR family transcriptional regulator [Parvibaculales bacterium]